MIKKYNLKNDLIFKTFFSKKGNEQFLIDFLESLLHIPIETIEIREEVNLERLAQDEKGGSLDLQAKLNNGIIINIEMQMHNEYNMRERTSVYGAKVLARETKRGTKYKQIEKIIMINILNYNLLEFDEYVSSTVTVLERHRECEVIDGIKYFFIELPKFRKENPDMNDKLNQWLALIDDTDRGKIEMAMEKNETIKKAAEEVEVLTGDEEIQRLAELRERWEMDRLDAISKAAEEAAEEAAKQATKETAKHEKNRIAKNMLNEKMPVELIVKVTGLTKEEVENIAK